MKEYRIGNAKVRVHGEVNQEKVKEAFAIFLKKAEKQKRRKKNNDDGKTR